MKTIVVGSLESSDCLITLQPADKTTIDIESVVYDAYGKRIRHVIERVLSAHQLTRVHVRCQDKGALDYAIEARLETAIKRHKEVNHGA